jgi:hypothetical protein
VPLNPSENAAIGLYSRPTGLDPTDDLKAIMAEVAAGLPNERQRIADALENQAYYDLDGDRYAPRREGETEFDYVGRSQRETGFTQEVIDVLCEHQYGCPPARQCQDKAVDEVLQLVYEQTHVNSVLHEAEVLSTLNDVAAIEVKATGDPAQPVELHVWGSEEFAAFIDPDRPTEALAVVTIDRVNGQTRYRLWTAKLVLTYMTKPWTQGMTTGGVVAYLQGTEPNTYGVLPFAFVHHREAVRRFWTPGLGTFLRKIESALNRQLSNIDELAWKFSAPIGVFTNVSPDYNPELGRGRFLRLYSMPALEDGGFGKAGEPSVEYLQAQLQLEQLWLDAEKFANRGLEACRVPLAAVRMEQSGMASGISLVVEQAPLITRAKQRRSMFVRYETRLAKLILLVVGNHYDRPELVAAAKTLRLLLSWPEPQIPIPGPDRDNGDQWEIQAGILSRVQLVMQRRGMTRDQALAYLKQVAEDEAEADKIMPPKPMPGLGQEPPAKGEGEGEAEPEDESETKPAKEPEDDETDDEDDAE